jgi:hypothetical protein
MTDIVERLRENPRTIHDERLIEIAADEIERLQAQIDTLRELREFDRKDIERLKTLLREPCNDAEFGCRP